MISVIKSNQRGRTKLDWLDSYHSFSFGEYYNPGMMGFGPLRVLNDDTVLPSAGFPTHPHRDMEIITIVTHGVIAHRDSSGGEGTIRVGEIQKMSAGSGIFHSEFNASDKETLKLYQIWIIPNEFGLKPSYEEFNYDPLEMKDKLLLLASGDVNDAVVFIKQDVKIYMSELSRGSEIDFTMDNSRGVYLHVINGSVIVGENSLTAGDAIATAETDNIKIKAAEDSKFLLFDVIMKY